VLCSPAVTTGVDFPHEHCRFQILLKLPFPTTTDRLTRARTARDASYPASLMLQSLVQATGRGMRGPTDWCDSFVLDAHALWAFAKYRHLAPEWFWRTVRRVWHIPAPPSYGSLEVQS
jgi:Rad3-related DNA helicase